MIHRSIELDVPELPVEFASTRQISGNACHCSRAAGQKETCASVLSKETYRAFPDEPRAFFGCCVHVGFLEDREYVGDLKGGILEIKRHSRIVTWNSGFPLFRLLRENSLFGSHLVSGIVFLADSFLRPEPPS